jgi:ribosomal protein S18 acetylase RimI-like enzyme
MSFASIRVASAADTDSVLALWNAADAVPSITDDAGSVRVAVERNAVLVAELDGQIVGTLIATFDGWRGSMYRLAVHPDHRREGIATALVDAGHRRLAKEGCRRSTALVVAEHEHAMEFWRAVGYEHDDRIARFVTTINGRLDAD